MGVVCSRFVLGAQERFAPVHRINRRSGAPPQCGRFPPTSQRLRQASGRWLAPLVSRPDKKGQPSTLAHHRAFGIDAGAASCRPRTAITVSESAAPTMTNSARSEEQTSELPSLMRISFAVFFLK